MFVYNLNVNKNNLFRIIIISILIFSIVFLGISVYNLYNKTRFVVSDNIVTSNITQITSDNYTQTLVDVYSNLDSHVGKSFNFTGYVYRLRDFKDSEFVLARDMLINSDSQSVVVGFLCDSDDSKNLKDNQWVNVTGTIIKGYYHDEIPVIDITEIKEAKEPDSPYVYPPANT